MRPTPGWNQCESVKAFLSGYELWGGRLCPPGVEKPSEPPLGPVRGTLRGMREADLEKYFLNACRREGWKPVKFLPSERGVPDRLVLTSGGGMFLVELKTETGRLSKAQELWHARAARLGTKVAVAKGRAGVDAWIAETRIRVAALELL